MTKDEFFVGCLALFVASVTAAISLGPWQAPYRIGSVARVQRRFGKPTARMLWLAFAIVAACSGVAILSGLRPGYADPVEHSQRAH